MRCQVWIGALVVALVAGGRGPGAEPWSSPDCYLQRLKPEGGWSPYGGGLLRWWNPCCFPRCGAPDDYCRKPLPKVCWPAYPGYYIWGPPEICCPQSNTVRDCTKTY
jgi:hypothetical protein